MLKRKIGFFLTTGALAAVALASCGGGGGGGGSTTKKMFTIDGLNNDLVFDGDDIVFENVEINLWSVINEPDNVAIRELVSQFNKSYLGEIKINMLEFSADDYYPALDTAWNYNPEEAPECTLMHNEKIVTYAYKDYLYPMNEILDKTKIAFNWSDVYENIDRANIIKHEGTDFRYSIPVDGHTFLFSIRQDMIKKNNLGFENNTRFYPKNRTEWQTLMQNARQKADAGELWYRSVDTADYSKVTKPHEWKLLPADTGATRKFYPAFFPVQDVTGLSTLYQNGSTLVNEAGNRIIVDQSQGFKNLLQDTINYHNNKYVLYPSASETRTNMSMFGAGETLMFEQGPWWVGQQYTYLYNNEEMGVSSYQGNDTGITAADAADPIYSKPLIAMNPAGWFASVENENNNKVYGNGHTIGITKQVKSMTKAAAILTFTKWLTSEKTSGAYNLTKHCLTGHLPAWKSVFNDQDYKTKAASSVVLQALGNPENIMAMENLRYQDICTAASTKTLDAVYSNLMGEDESKKTYAVALDEMSAVVRSTQTALNLKIESEE